MSKRRRVNKRRRDFRTTVRPCLSSKGRLAFSRAVRHSSEHIAYLLAGQRMPPELATIACWRGALASPPEQRDGGPFAVIKSKIGETLIESFRLARAVQQLRLLQRREQGIHIFLGVLPVEGYTEAISGKPGVLYLLVCARPRERESVDVMFARQQAIKTPSGLSDGASFGAIGVRVEQAGRIRGVVVWENNLGAQLLYQLTERYFTVMARRLARRALRREARRLLGHVEKALRAEYEGKTRANGTQQQAAEAQEAADETPV